MSGTAGMRLVDLIDGLDVHVAAGDGSTRVSDLSDDSRTLSPGSLFVARNGSQGHGRAYIADALRGGAAAVLTDHLPPDRPYRDVAWLVAESIDQQLAGRMAERFWNHPSSALELIGVTGTNGKTTTAFLIQHLLCRAGLRCGMIGTVTTDLGGGSKRTTATLTTPGAIDLSRYLAAMVGHGCRAAVLEVSSHGLDQDRASALHFDVAVFTNLTGDHLDYHPTMDEYAAAKAKLFEQLGPQACAVINSEDAYAARMLQACRARVLRCGSSVHADCRSEIVRANADHSHIRFHGSWGSGEAKIPLIGAFNVRNALLALAAVDQVTGVAYDSGQVTDALASCPPVPGRLERVVSARVPGQGPVVLVDYAHTHDALRNVLVALRPLVPKSGLLKVVFGCGGDRDRTKRPKMAVAACELADRILITSDNPRSENPGAIIDEILRGVPHAARWRVEVEPDRTAAISGAIDQATDCDIVLIAGKGHENYQIVDTHRHRFDDREKAAAALDQWTKLRRGHP